MKTMKATALGKGKGVKKKPASLLKVSLKTKNLAKLGKLKLSEKVVAVGKNFRPREDEDARLGNPWTALAYHGWQASRPLPALTPCAILRSAKFCFLAASWARPSLSEREHVAWLLSAGQNDSAVPAAAPSDAVLQLSNPKGPSNQYSYTLPDSNLTYITTIRNLGT